ncbi:hypothetical protein JL722_8126 [Aureococcus anophagefferens]|nr:hypothetical protein JL722_8126 [Aureococcus anophagefferens]
MAASSQQMRRLTNTLRRFSSRRGAADADAVREYGAGRQRGRAARPARPRRPRPRTTGLEAKPGAVVWDATDLEADARATGEPLIGEGLQAEFEEKAANFLKQLSAKYKVPVKNCGDRRDDAGVTLATATRYELIEDGDDEAASVGDGSREAMIRAARHWRGLGEEGDDAFEDKGVVLPEARAWIQAVAAKEAAEREREKASTEAQLARLEPVEFATTRCCARTYATGVPLLRCRHVDDDEAAVIAALGMAACFNALARSLQAGGDATTALLMARLRALFDAGADGDGNVEMQIHTLGRGLIFHADDGFFDRLWAAPGMASHLLFDDWLLDEIERKERRWFPLGVPSEEALGDMEPGPARAAAETLIAQRRADARRLRRLRRQQAEHEVLLHLL